MQLDGGSSMVDGVFKLADCRNCNCVSENLEASCAEVFELFIFGLVWNFVRVQYYLSKRISLHPMDQ